MIQQADKITINIDGQDVQVPAGINLVEALKLIGQEIPHYCYHPKLSVAGNCRMCLVETGMIARDPATKEIVLDEAGKPKVAWSPRPAIGCGTTVTPGLHVRTKSKLAQDCQKGVTEFLLVNHPLDCPICDQAGECKLQEFSADYGRGESRFIEEKVVKPKRTQIGPRVMLDDERCILCSRCVRFCKEIIHEDVLGFTQRGSYTTLTNFPGKELSSNYSLNTVDICPVGALTSTDFRFKMRVWFLKKTNSICTESSVGVNTVVHSREGKIYRITPRQNDEVNDTWMSDSGRLLYKQVEDENRLTKYTIHKNTFSKSDAVKRVSELLPTGKIAYVASGRLSVEAQYMLKKLMDAFPGSLHFIAHKQVSDGLLISNDATPNTRGAYVTGLLEKTNKPVTELPFLASAIEEKQIQTVISFCEDLTALGVSQTTLKKTNLIYFGNKQNPSSDVATVVLPLACIFEKSGTFVNQQFRLQKFQAAIPAPTDIVPGEKLISEILTLSGKQVGLDLSNTKAIWEDMAKNIAEFTDMAFDKIPDSGRLLDASNFQDIEFPETKTLHFEPKNAIAH